MVSINYIKSLLAHKGIKQQQLADEWSKVSDSTKAQSYVSKYFKENEFTNYIDLIDAVSNLTGVPFMDIKKELSYDRDDREIMFVSEPGVSYETGDNETIPILSYTAAAESLLGQQSLKGDGVISLPKALLKNGVHVCKVVNGHAMEPTLMDGSYAIFILVSENDWHMIPNSMVCMIAYEREGKLYKSISRIKNKMVESVDSSEAVKPFIIEKFDNADKGKYPDHNIEKDEIKAIWQLEWALNSKFFNPFGGMKERMNDIDDRTDLNAIQIQRLFKEMEAIKNN